MILGNTTPFEDDVLTKCENFGSIGDAISQCVAISDRLDRELSEALEKLSGAEDALAEVTEERDKLQAYIDKHSDFLKAVDNITY